MPTVKLKLARQHKGLTQSELAEMLNTQKSSICNWENSKSVPSYGKLKQLEKILEKPIDYLLEPIEENNTA